MLRSVALCEKCDQKTKEKGHTSKSSTTIQVNGANEGSLVLNTNIQWYVQKQLITNMNKGTLFENNTVLEL